MGDATIGEITALLQGLVAIDSVNPDLVPGARGEGQLALFVARWLSQHDLDVQTQETGAAGRTNVVAVAHGSGEGRSLMLNAHLDTVGVAGMVAPFDPTMRDGRLYGRGSADTKGGLAAFMLAAAKAQQQRLRGNVVLASVVDEEYASLGSVALVQQVRTDAALVAEPTGLRLITAHKGFVWLQVETQGVAAHGSRPEAGVDAIIEMGKVLAALDRQARQLAQAAPHPLVGVGSVHASLIEGGQELSSYPASCRLSIERRTLPGETAEGVEAEWRQLLASLARDDPRFRATLRLLFARQPLEVPVGAAIVETLVDQAGRVLGCTPTIAGFGAWTDAALLTGAGIPAVIFGPAGEGYHGVEEWVDLRSVEQCYEAVLGTACQFCG